MIPENLLYEFGGERKAFSKSDSIFKENQQAHYYFQLISGEVKMNNYLENGKEFIQGIFSAPRSFGEPPLFAQITYPANAIAITDIELIQLKKEAFFELLLAHPEIHLKVTEALASRLYYKSIMASEMSSQEPEHRILRMLDYLKHDIYQLTAPFSFQVNLTRQQIADLTGLRVETVIRAIKSLERKGMIKIKSRKVYR
ncbi:Crp/Fnr family transcriptional regulator [Mesonia sp. K7]|uniref:Crp/Fnr family transcriptional regulator n=1 Tax=Mesonia sp. K7 TaxID=2218606 RepID=UPI000DA7B955|nr:Crp/Fnr family transcriptional regulator [Mesonia sp. K7]PZD76696.1 Crp/Fnr family transcriptional regulator [Mesonia sp. K7]